MARVYALLVGIDNYLAPLPPLQGCRNDVEEVGRFLRDSAAVGDLSVETLCDADATRAAVIDAFRRHLSQAGPGDAALFWFSGHGSTAPVPERWWHLEPSGELQTVLCADSRHNGVPELLDKELAILIREVAARGAHVAMVLDCCHAAGATRAPVAARIRLAPCLPVPPEPELLLPELEGVMRGATVASLGAPDHVALAACRSHQAAYEITLGGAPRGVFSLALLAELSRPGRAPTYRDLLTGARCRVENLIMQQVPVLYPADQPLADQPFLGGEVRPPAATMTMRYVNGSWEIDAGACHGLRSGAGDEAVRVAVHGSDPVCEARVVRVYPDRSAVAPVGWHPDRSVRYPVVLAHVPLPATTVAIQHPAAGAKAAGRLVAALGSAAPDGGPSPHVRLVAGDDPAQLPEIVVDLSYPGRWRLLGADNTPLTGDIPDGDRAEAGVVSQLEHIARWRQVKVLANPISRLAGSVRMEVVLARPSDVTAPLDRPALLAGENGDIELAYRHSPEGWQAPTVFIRLHNTADRRVYCVLLDLTDRFRLHTELLPGTFIAPGHAAAAAEGEPVALSLPPGRAVRPGAQVRDWLMVIAAEEEINSAVFALPRLGEPSPDRARGQARGPLALTTIVERLGLTALHRDADRTSTSARDWWTTIVPVVTRVPAAPPRSSSS
jgi:hypothetical protein